MTKAGASCAAFIAAFGAAGCLEESGDPTTLEDLEVEARRIAGAGAVGCGTTQAGADRSTTNCCVAGNYTQSLPTYAVYMEQGIDTMEAVAVAADNSGAVTYLVFHGRLGDVRPPWEGEIVREPCANPVLAADVCSDPAGRPFACS